MGVYRVSGGIQGQSGCTALDKKDVVVPKHPSTSVTKAILNNMPVSGFRPVGLFFENLAGRKPKKNNYTKY